MKDHGLIFKPEMVRALLDETKTQTRRVINLSGRWHMNELHDGSLVLFVEDKYGDWKIKDPYKVGDRIWVREGWGLLEHRNFDEVIFRQYCPGLENVKWKSPIHLCKTDARIWRVITDVKIERLQNITEYDSQCEGCKPAFEDEWGMVHTTPWYRYGFKKLWESIHNTEGKRWNDNPWVFAITFRHIENPYSINQQAAHGGQNL